MIEAYCEEVTFFIPESALSEAEEHLAVLAVKRGGDPLPVLALLRSLAELAEVVGPDVYVEFERDARELMGARDPDDWPILAAALAIGCPIWTEDTDFFGCGVAVWTTGRIEKYLRR